MCLWLCKTQHCIEGVIFFSSPVCGRRYTVRQSVCRGTEEQCLRAILITCAVSTETKHKKSAQEKFYTVPPERKDIRVNPVCSCVFLVWFTLHLLAKCIRVLI